jgi:hypothetical protein
LDNRDIRFRQAAEEQFVSAFGNTASRQTRVSERCVVAEKRRLVGDVFNDITIWEDQTPIRRLYDKTVRYAR